MNGAKITREWEHHWIEVIFLVALWLEAEKKMGRNRVVIPGFR